MNDELKDDKPQFIVHRSSFPVPGSLPLAVLTVRVA
jgi:hypothetical protein